MPAGVAFPLVQKTFRIGIRGQVWLYIGAVALRAESDKLFLHKILPLFYINSRPQGTGEACFFRRVIKISIIRTIDFDWTMQYFAEIWFCIRQMCFFVDRDQKTSPVQFA